MFIRKKVNRSGTTSLHIFRKEGQRQIHVKSIGSGSSAEEIRILERQAHLELEKLVRQQSLDLQFDEDKKFIDAFSNNIRKIEVAGYELILGKLFREIGFDVVTDDLFRHLVLSRISHPGSKLKTINYLQEHHSIFFDMDSVYRYLDKIHSKHKSILQEVSYQHTQKLFKGQIQLLFYDVTTLYFEAEDEDDLRKTGFSKDGKAQHPQILLGLLVSAQGYPLSFEMFEGNKFEGKTMLPVVEAFTKKYGMAQAIVVADAGLLSSENINDLIRLKYQFILGGRIKNESKVLQSQILALKLNDQIHTLIRPDGLKLIVSHSSTRATKDKSNRVKGLHRLEQAIRLGKLSKKHINNRGYNKYLKLEGQITVQIDYGKFNQDTQWDGLKGYVTNAALPPEEIINHYKNLWHIEKAFRISKTDLRIRPIYHRLKNRIESHLIIAFCSYKLYKELERQLAEKKVGISIEKAIRLMQSVFAIEIQLPQSGRTAKLLHVKTEDHKQLLKAFNIDLLN
ncbi:MAG: IS1634 family transposase [Chryseotalea sp. WA131a]|nr:MAG: IS1634 family transposase [Chryseotalea sp. WA131a]